MIRALLYFPAGDPMTEDLVTGLSALEGVELTVAHDAAAAMRAIPDTEVLFTIFAERPLIEAARSLRWIQALVSGTDAIKLRADDMGRIVLTNAHGLVAGAVSEGALGLMLALARDIPRVSRNMAAHLWQPWTAKLLSGSTVTILGVGAISEALGMKCKAIGMRVEGVSRTERELPGFDRIHPRSALLDAVAAADFVVLLAPADPSTRGIINRDVIAAMKPSAFLVNVARGDLVDDDALIDALRQGRIAGAALDTVNGEPLGKDHHYWDVPRLLITPHMAGRHQGYTGDLIKLIAANVRLYSDGRLNELRNIVRK